MIFCSSPASLSISDTVACSASPNDPLNELLYYIQSMLRIQADILTWLLWEIKNMKKEVIFKQLSEYHHHIVLLQCLLSYSLETCLFHHHHKTYFLNLSFCCTLVQTKTLNLGTESFRSILLSLSMKFLNWWIRKERKVAP